MQIRGAEDANKSANKMAQDVNNDENKLKDLALFMLDLLAF